MRIARIAACGTCTCMRVRCRLNSTMAAWIHCQNHGVRYKPQCSHVSHASRASRVSRVCVCSVHITCAAYPARIRPRVSSARYAGGRNACVHAGGRSACVHRAYHAYSHWSRVSYTYICKHCQCKLKTRAAMQSTHRRDGARSGRSVFARTVTRITRIARIPAYRAYRCGTLGDERLRFGIKAGVRHTHQNGRPKG